jgi:hypothetical protein
MSRLEDFLLGAPMNVAAIDVVKISHPYFSQDYWMQNVDVAGATLTIEGQSRDIPFAGFRVLPLARRSVLERGLDIEIGDLGGIVHAEQRALEANDGYRQKPVVDWYQYRSDDLNVPIMGPERYEANRVNREDRSTRIEARNLDLNVNASGERYTLDRFPMQVGVGT